MAVGGAESADQLPNNTAMEAKPPPWVTERKTAEKDLREIVNCEDTSFYFQLQLL